MERIPTQTDLVRLCDAASDITGYYHRQIATGHGDVQGFTWQLDMFANIVRLLPHPRHYWTPFDIDFWEPREHWVGWSDDVYDAFAHTIFHARYIHQRWISAAEEAAPRDRIQPTPGGEVETQIRLLEESSAALRRSCQVTLCELQQDILNALDGQAMTADELEHATATGRQRLFGLKKDKAHGGLHELVALGLIVNGRNDGSGIRGYYRPDRPPEKAH